MECSTRNPKCQKPARKSEITDTSLFYEPVLTEPLVKRNPKCRKPARKSEITDTSLFYEPVLTEPLVKSFSEYQQSSYSESLSYHHRHKVIRSSRGRLSSSKCTKPHVEKKLKKTTKKTQMNCKMCCFILILVIGILSALIIPLAWESCHEVPQLNEESMATALSSIVFGQELAIHIVTSSLQTHLTRLKADIYQPLLLSFHGSSGVGKTFLSSQISHFLPANTKVIKYHPSIHSKAGKAADVYERDIWFWIMIHSSFCSWNIIVVDDAQDVTEEVQKAFKKVLSNMKASWLYRRMIVIFVSNVYSSEINDVVFEKVMQQGQSTFDMSDFDSVFERGSSSWLMELHREGLLDAFVPFLPMDKNTVLKCIEQELNKYKTIPFKDIANEISNDIVFYRLEGTGYQYSISGCKKVSDKVALWLNSL